MTSIGKFLVFDLLKFSRISIYYLNKQLRYFKMSSLTIYLSFIHKQNITFRVYIVFDLIEINHISVIQAPYGYSVTLTTGKSVCR